MKRAAGIAGLVLLTGAVQAAPVLVVYYAFEETSGTAAADGSGNGFGGTHQGGVVISAAGDCAPVPTGDQRSIVLNQGANAYVSRVNNAAYTFTGAFTAAAWIKPAPLAAGVNPNDRGAVIQKWNWVSPPGTINGYGFDRHRDGRIIFFTGTDTAYNTQWSTATAPDNLWTHVACTYDGTVKKIYINGSLDVTTAYTAPGASTASLHIGKDDWTRYFYGNVDEVRLYGQALTDTEISVLHAGMPAPTGLIATADIGQIHLSWSLVAGATSYTVYQSTTSGTGYAPVGTATGTTFTATGLSHPTRYYFVVVAQGLMSSGYSNEADEVPLSATPRTNDHEEGLLEDKCACGSSIPGGLPAGAALAALLVLAARAGRRR